MALRLTEAGAAEAAKVRAKIAHLDFPLSNAKLVGAKLTGANLTARQVRTLHQITVIRGRTRGTDVLDGPDPWPRGLEQQQGAS